MGNVNTEKKKRQRKRRQARKREETIRASTMKMLNRKLGPISDDEDDFGHPLESGYFGHGQE